MSALPRAPKDERRPVESDLEMCRRLGALGLEIALAWKEADVNGTETVWQLFAKGYLAGKAVKA